MGLDGLPYAVYTAAGMKGYRLLYKLYPCMLNGELVPRDSLEALMAFLLKGDKEEDFQRVIRKPCETRPLAFANCDAKSVTKAICEPLGEVAKQTADWRQRGFIKGRLMLESIIEVEADGICASILNDIDPGMFFIDFEAAFCMLAHSWIAHVLIAMGLPLGLVLFSNGSAERGSRKTPPTSHPKRSRSRQERAWPKALKTTS